MKTKKGKPQRVSLGDNSLFENITVIDESATDIGDGVLAWKMVRRAKMFGVVSDKSKRFFPLQLGPETVEKMNAHAKAGRANGRRVHPDENKSLSGNTDLGDRIVKGISYHLEDDGKTLVETGYLLADDYTERLRNQHRAGMDMPCSLHGFAETVLGEVAPGIRKHIVQSGPAYDPRCLDFVGESAFEAGVSFMESADLDAGDDVEPIDNNDEPTDEENEMADVTMVKEVTPASLRKDYPEVTDILVKDAVAEAKAKWDEDRKALEAKAAGAEAESNKLTAKVAELNTKLEVKSGDLTQAVKDRDELKAKIAEYEAREAEIAKQSTVRAHFDGTLTGAGELKALVSTKLDAAKERRGGKDETFDAYYLRRAGGDVEKAKAEIDADIADALDAARIQSGITGTPEDIAHRVASGNAVPLGENPDAPKADAKDAYQAGLDAIVASV